MIILIFWDTMENYHLKGKFILKNRTKFYVMHDTNFLTATLHDVLINLKKQNDHRFVFVMSICIPEHDSQEQMTRL